MFGGRAKTTPHRNIPHRTVPRHNVAHHATPYNTTPHCIALHSNLTDDLLTAASQWESVNGVSVYGIWSCNHKYCTLTCLNFPTPERLTKPIAAVASLLTLPCSRMPTSAARLIRPSARDAPFTIAYNSASPDDSAITPCPVADVRMHEFPNVEHVPLVDFRVRIHPT